MLTYPQQSGDLLGAATTMKRFRAVQKLIPVAATDLRVMEEAEERLVTVCVLLPIHGPIRQAPLCSQLCSLFCMVTPLPTHTHRSYQSALMMRLQAGTLLT